MGLLLEMGELFGLNVGKVEYSSSIVLYLSLEPIYYTWRYVEIRVNDQ